MENKLYKFWKNNGMYFLWLKILKLIPPVKTFAILQL